MSLQDELLTWTSQLRTGLPSILEIQVQHIAYCITCTTSTGASLHEAPELQQLALNFLAPFFSRRHLRAQFSSDFFSLVVALNNHRHTSARAQKMFTLPNMRPLSIREASPPWGTGGPSAGSAYHKIDQHGSSSCKSTFGLLYSL